MKNRRSKSLSGTVLIMVLTVMMVLIIMLMATMAVVSTAGQRVYTKYEENQAFYTSRSALDIFVGQMLSDSQYKIGGSSQGYELQKMLYTVKCYDGATVKNPRGEGTTSDAYNKSDVRDADGNNIVSGGVSREFLEFEVSLPQITGSASNVYGRFDDSDPHTPEGKFAPTKIKVEVLERKYDANNNRKKDSMKIKVTATSFFNGVESSSAVVLSTSKPTANTATRAVTITNQTPGDMNNNAILGGVATQATNTNVNNMYDYWGNTYIGGNIAVGSAASIARFVLTEDQWVYVKGNFETDNGCKFVGEYDTTDESKRPNVYIGGDFKPGQMKSGVDKWNNEKKVNIIVGGDCIINKDYEHYGDMYVMGNFTIDNGCNGAKFHGNLYVGGDFNIYGSGAQNGFEVDGNMMVASGKSINVAGDRMVKVSVSGTSGFTYDFSSQIGSGTTYSSDMPKLTVDDDKHCFVIRWKQYPADQEIADDIQLYTQFYRYADSLNEGTITASEYAFLGQDEIEQLMTNGPDSEFEYPDDFKVIHDYIDSKGDVEELPCPMNVPSGWKHVVTAGGTYKLPAMDNGQNRRWEFTTGESELFLEPGNYGLGTVVVHSGATLKVIAPPGVYNFNKFMFITDEVESSDPLYVGESAPTGKNLMSMPISYYFEGESTISFSNTDSIFVGHVYAPRATVNAGSSGVSGSILNNLSHRLMYNGVSYNPDDVQPDMGFLFIGSLLCEDYILGQSAKGSVAFVKSSADVPPAAGEPFLTLKPSVYIKK